MKNPTSTDNALAGHSTQNSDAIITDTECQHQRDAIIRALYRESRNTFEFRAIGITSAAPRIKELRDAGWDIRTSRETATDMAGVKHSGIARYSLHGFIERVVGGVV
jgi:hypothetical protein